MTEKKGTPLYKTQIFWMGMNIVILLTLALIIFFWKVCEDCLLK